MNVFFPGIFELRAFRVKSSFILPWFERRIPQVLKRKKRWKITLPKAEMDSDGNFYFKSQTNIFTKSLLLILNFEFNPFVWEVACNSFETLWWQKPANHAEAYKRNSLKIGNDFLIYIRKLDQLCSKAKLNEARAFKNLVLFILVFNVSYLPVSILSLTMQFPERRTASQCSVQPLRGISMMSPGTKRSEGSSRYSVEKKKNL